MKRRTTSRPGGAHVIAGIIVVVVSLSACSDAGVSVSELDLPAKDVESWTMPLDAYFATNTDSRVESYAQNILTDACMHEAGFKEWPASWSELEWPEDPVFTATGMRRFSVKIAKEYGYGFADVPDPSSDLLRKQSEAINEMMTPDMDKQSRKCFKQVDSALQYGNTQVANGFWIEVSDRVRQSDAVREARSRWGRCLSPVGIADLPASPDDMPTTWMNQRFVEDEERSGRDRGPLELKWALADAKCRESSGYTKALYDGMWNGQVEVMRTHLDELERGKAAIEKNRDKALKVINAYNPETDG